MARPHWRRSQKVASIVLISLATSKSPCNDFDFDARVDGLDGTEEERRIAQ